MTRADENNNPTAFTTAVAETANLILGTDYIVGTPFDNGTYFTAKILGDPLETTIKLIDRIGFYNKEGTMRWSYVAIPYKIWIFLSHLQKAYVIGQMYNQEGGTAMQSLFPENP